MASNPAQAFVLRPVPQSDRRPKNLGEFIARVNADRGFRNVTEESLRKDMEAEAEANGMLESKEVDMVKGEGEDGDGDGANGEDDEDADQVGMEDLHQAIGDVRLHAEAAHQNAMLALDFVSLLITKENPRPAQDTVSPALRDLVGIGSLGADKLAASNITPQRLLDNKLVATGWKFADIDRTVNSVLTSASRLQKEISVETKYWAEVLAVSEKGWSVTRVPNEPETLGVRYGFSEAAPGFRNTSLAPMRRGDDGTVDLDCGKMLGESQRLLVTIEKNRRIVGRSALPRPLPQDAPLEERVLEARNTIFAQELWHEMNREGRLLQSYGVRLEDEALSYTLEDNLRIVFSLQPLEQAVEEGASETLPEDYRAESLSSALHQLLTYAHRINNQRRSRPDSKNRDQSTTMPPYPLLRPVLANLQHETSIADATGFISDLSTILHSAGISTVNFKLTEPPISLDLVSTHGSPSEALIQALFGPLELQYELNITPESRLLVHCKTVMGNVIATTYHVSLLPPAQGGTNPLSTAYHPVHLHGEGYTLRDLKYYLQQAVARVLVDRASSIVLTARAPSPSDEDELPIVWAKHISGVALENSNDSREQLRFEVILSELGHPELHLFGSWVVDQPKPATRTWTWTVGDVKQGLKKESIEQVLRNVVARVAQPQP
ncbi:mediator of rna polymerase ii transcription subunit 17 [Diaporthe amygdali]|uniref:mediator of rna polymerase ii transcription subunit 17 n=1 Tax=Phomopsis amygdali TaxID=1214568 RepID=UPI0022FE441D|nr:mediator of rna polymerase ii transcription subunit 17 [Diaporthe amygdali]KAJ0123323.1 mediator of rna polymerase ii transcription subunit 17 [Diaporthe amygdali]